MHRWRLAVAVGVLSVGAAAIVACGLDQNGLLSDAGGIDGGQDVVTQDVVLDVVVDVPTPPPCGDGGPSCKTTAVGRDPGLFALDQKTACPPGFNTQDLVMNPTAHDKCTCQCDDGGAPSCDPSTVAMHVSDAGGCTGTFDLTADAGDGGACGATSVNLPDNGSVSFDKPAMVGGCSGGKGVPSSTKVDGTPARLCIPADCTEAVCQQQAGFKNCQYLQGNVLTCPDGYDGGFYQAIVPSGTQVTCEGCSCSASGDCNGAQVSLYNDGTCQAGAVNFGADGKCHDIDTAHSGAFGSVSTSVKAPTNVACTPSNATPEAGVAYPQNAVFTVCCKP